MKKFKLFFCILLSLTIFNTLKSAEQIDPIKVDWSFKGLLGKFDRASLQREDIKYITKFVPLAILCSI